MRLGILGPMIGLLAVSLLSGCLDKQAEAWKARLEGTSTMTAYLNNSKELLDTRIYFYFDQKQHPQASLRILAEFKGDGSMVQDYAYSWFITSSGQTLQAITPDNEPPDRSFLYLESPGHIELRNESLGNVSMKGSFKCVMPMDPDNTKIRSVAEFKAQFPNVNLPLGHDNGILWNACTVSLSKSNSSPPLFLGSVLARYSLTKWGSNQAYSDMSNDARMAWKKLDDMIKPNP